MDYLIELLSQIFKKVFFVFSVATIIYLIYLFSIAIGIHNARKGSNFNSYIIKGITTVISLSGRVVLLYIAVLLIIYMFWIFIIVYVPEWVYFPLTFIPFVLPIPLQRLLLMIYPFPELTDRGVLPLMRRLINRTIELEQSKSTTENTKDLFRYFYDDLKMLFNGILSQEEDSDLSLLGERPTDANYRENQLKTKKKKEEPKENEETIRMRQLIDDEVSICINSKLASRINDKSFSGDSSINAYADCYSTGINSYFNNLIK
jgi:hypothetical protein